jgi:hypothetical protein
MRTRIHSPLVLWILASTFLLGCGKQDKDKEGPAPPPQPAPQGGPQPGGNPLAAGNQPQPGTTGIRRVVDRQTAQNQLQQIGLAYHSFWDANAGRGPSSVEELSPFYEKNRGITDAIKSGYYVVYWKATIASMQMGASNTVLAYEKDPERDGGQRMVVMGDCSVKRMNEAEFRAAPKAGR